MLSVAIGIHHLGIRSNGVMPRNHSVRTLVIKFNRSHADIEVI